MKVYIGPYRHHWTTQSAERLWYKLRYKKYDWEVENPDRLDKAVERVLDICRDAVCRPVNFIKQKIPRTQIVKIDDYDCWGADHTIALITLPILKRLQEKKHGAPFTEDEDVPEHLRSTAAPKVEEWETDALHFQRWDWIMNEMIWTFEQLAAEDDESQFFHEGSKEDVRPEGWHYISGFGLRDGFWVDRPGEEAHRKRIDNGLRLFGRYFRALWD
jgi:hypothetical protein